jgi:hypothetical protein
MLGMVLAFCGWLPVYAREDSLRRFDVLKYLALGGWSTKPVVKLVVQA